MHDFSVGLHPSELDLKNWKNPRICDPEFYFSVTIADRENLRALSDINIYAKV